jgi:scyllo-inositol 2-dehydrogenase (NADP+)
MDPQEEMLRNGKTPKSPGWGVEPEAAWGTLATAEGGSEKVQSLPGSYEAFYRQIYQALNGQAKAPVDPADVYRTACIIEAAITSCNEQKRVALTCASV